MKSRNPKFIAMIVVAVALLLSLLFIVAACNSQPQYAQVSNYGDVVAQSLTLNGKLVTSSTAITLTAGQTITPTTSTYLLSSSGAVSMTLAPCSASTVKFVTLYGDDNNTITVNDTNIYTTDGNAATLGQYDVVGWACAGTKWSLAWKSANQ